MTVKPLVKYHLEFLSLKGGCTGSSESTDVEMPHCLKSHVAAQVFFTEGHKIFLEGLTNYLEIKNSLSWKFLEPLGKIQDSLELSFSFQKKH